MQTTAKCGRGFRLHFNTRPAAARVVALELYRILKIGNWKEGRIILKL